MRAIALLILIAAALIAWGDWQSAEGQGYVLRAVGLVWDGLHRPSLLFMNNLISRHISNDLWEAVWVPVLELPAAPTVGLIGLVVLLFSRRR